LIDVVSWATIEEFIKAIPRFIQLLPIILEKVKDLLPQTNTLVLREVLLEEFLEAFIPGGNGIWLETRQPLVCTTY
jgi:hypothetical protein